ncbi:MAG: hypothetical protein GX444_18280 [Myxococcales bacterium]|nr:hypothetical protein [Myxococcales bacterium]
MTPRADDRIGYIDLLKGLACLIILYVHAVTPRVDLMKLPDLAVFTLLFFSAGLFFFASGMNIVNFLNRHRDDPPRQVGRFFLAAAAMLFGLSICYSVNHSSLRLPQIFQGIALCTAVTFLLLRTRLPNWALILVALALYALWLPYWVRVEPLVAPLRSLSFNEEVRLFLPWANGRGPFERFFLLHFSLLPWVSYTLAGAATYRSIRQNPAAADRWWLFYALLPLVGLLSYLFLPWRQPLFLRSYPDMILRNYPLPFFVWLGLTGLALLTAARWYAGGEEIRSAIGRRLVGYLEFLGRESFLFLVWHWFVLTVLSLFLAVLLRNPGYAASRWSIYFPWFVTTVVVVATMPWAQRLGDRWRRHRHFVLEASLVLALGTTPGLISFALRGTVRLPAIFSSFAACLAFAYLYPVLREKLRRRLRQSVDRQPPA